MNLHKIAHKIALEAKTRYMFGANQIQLHGEEGLCFGMDNSKPKLKSIWNFKSQYSLELFSLYIILYTAYQVVIA